MNYYDDYNYFIDEKGLDIKEINEGYLNGFHIRKQDIESKGSNITFGGSEGGSYYDIAKIIANHGYEVLALYFFGKANQPQSLNRIPLEFFREVLEYIKINFNSFHPITILSASKGAELALVLGEYYEEIDNLILIAPSAYRFQGIDFKEKGSSWTINNIDLEYISFDKVSLFEKSKLTGQFVFKKTKRLRAYYESAIKNAKNKELARIKSEKFKGNILLLMGEDDGMWNSYEMAKVIKESNPNSSEIVLYPNVGHAFGVDNVAGGYYMGGEIISNKEAFNDSTEKVILTIKRWHKF